MEVLQKSGGYQFASYTLKQVFHKNIAADSLASSLLEAVSDKFMQVNAFAPDRQFQLMISKKGQVTLKASRVTSDVSVGTQHNRQKNYLLPEGVIIPPLVDMGVFTKDGRVVSSMQDKYRQINRFVELIDQAFADSGREKITILDFGCGKSYLTFIQIGRASCRERV